MITLSPETITIGQRLATLRSASDIIIADLAALAPCLTDAPQPQETPRSSQAHLRDIRQIITRVADMTEQAYRAYNRRDIQSAADTLAACHATLAGELPIRLRAWSHTEPNPDIRLLLDDWIASLEELQETPC